MRDKQPQSRRRTKDAAARTACAQPCPTPQKLRYDTKRKAKRAARITRLTPYKCVCGKYHLTSTGRRYVL